jgi:hypothetical protein
LNEEPTRNELPTSLKLSRPADDVDDDEGRDDDHDDDDED